MGRRERFIDFDSRRAPKTKVFCVACQKDLLPGAKRRWVWLTDHMHAVHSEDVKEHKKPSDYGWEPIGLDCANKLGTDYTFSEVANEPQ